MTYLWPPHGGVEGLQAASATCTVGWAFDPPGYPPMHGLTCSRGPLWGCISPSPPPSPCMEGTGCSHVCVHDPPQCVEGTGCSHVCVHDPPQCVEGTGCSHVCVHDPPQCMEGTGCSHCSAAINPCNPQGHPCSPHMWLRYPPQCMGRDLPATRARRLAALAPCRAQGATSRLPRPATAPQGPALRFLRLRSPWRRPARVSRRRGRARR